MIMPPRPRGTITFAVEGDRSLLDEATCRAIVVECRIIARLLPARRALLDAGDVRAADQLARRIYDRAVTVHALAADLGFPYPNDGTTAGARVTRGPSLPEVLAAALAYPRMLYPLPAATTEFAIAKRRHVPRSWERDLVAGLASHDVSAA